MEDCDYGCKAHPGQEAMNMIGVRNGLLTFFFFFFFFDKSTSMEQRIGDSAAWRAA